MEVEPVRLVGVYSHPEHVFAYDDGEVQQEFNVGIACRVVGGELAAGDEAREVGVQAFIESWFGQFTKRCACRSQ